MRRKRRAFTLVELLVVIAIISVIGAGGVMLVNFNSGRQSLVTAQQTLMSSFEEARILACAKSAKARVVIYKGDDNSRRLRQVGIIYESLDDDGNSNGWVSHSSGTMLPKNTFFIPPSGEFNSQVKIDSDSMSEADVINSTFSNGATGAPRVVGMANFGSRRAQSVGEGNGEWYCYEFSAEGLSENPNARIIVATGTQNAKGEFIMKNPFDILGFTVLRTGKTVGFTDYEEIKEAMLQ